MHKKITGMALAILFSLGAATASAQNFSSLLKNMTQAKELVGTIKSVSDVSFGQVTRGAPAPQDAEGKVVLYRTSWCGYCKRAETYMQQKNIPFVERDIEASSTNKAEYTRLGGKGPVPFLVFGSQTMSGFSEGAFDQHYAQFQHGEASMANGSGRSTAPVYIRSASPQSAPVSTSVQSGDTLVAKIPGIKVYTQASKSAAKLLLLGKADEVVYMGEERDGLYRVTSSQGEGWVDKLLVKKL